MERPQRIDTAVDISHLQRRVYDAVNGRDLRKVREWLEVRGPVNCDNYQIAGYLQAVASKTGRRRLAQFSMGSHMLGVETGRWQRLPRAQRLCQRCSCGVVDDEAHMVWGCPALIDQRVQHSELFEDSNITTVADFMQQDAGQLAAFLRVCHEEGRLHECPGKASWLMQGPQRERHAHTNKTKLKKQRIAKHRTQNPTGRFLAGLS